MTIVFKPVVLPADLVGVKPGSLGPCLLRPLFFAGVGNRDMHHLAADAAEAMIIACQLETGYALTTVGAYRSTASCLKVFYERMTATYNPLVNSRTTRTGPDGKKWYLRRGMAPVAGFTNGVPDSNHAKGLANDFAIWSSGKVVGITSIAKVWAWVKDNAESFGFSWEGAKEGQPGWEPWHLRYVAGDKIPARVLDMQAFFRAQAAQ